MGRGSSDTNVRLPLAVNPPVRVRTDSPLPPELSRYFVVDGPITSLTSRGLAELWSVVREWWESSDFYRMAGRESVFGVRVPFPQDSDPDCALHVSVYGFPIDFRPASLINQLYAVHGPRYELAVEYQGLSVPVEEGNVGSDCLRCAPPTCLHRQIALRLWDRRDRLPERQIRLHPDWDGDS